MVWGRGIYIVKGIKNGCPCIVEIRGMQGCALVGGRPCTSHRRMQGQSQGTTLSASDLHNARATILNPFYKMEYRIIKKTRQNTTWIEEDILGINLTPNWYNALAPAMVYVNRRHNPIQLRDVTIATQERYCELTWMGPKLFWNLRIGPRTYLYFFMCKGWYVDVW